LVRTDDRGFFRSGKRFRKRIVGPSLTENCGGESCLGGEVRHHRKKEVTRNTFLSINGKGRARKNQVSSAE